MLNGGPDQQWVETGANWALGANRLSIQGIDGGEQPFRLGNHLCVFNGEIYNHRALRAKLKSHGHAFPDTCDGNVILPLYQEFGKDFLAHLEGMYALVIIELDADGQCTSVLMASDQAAMKTVFYSVTEAGMFFASSLPALRALIPTALATREDYVFEYMTRKTVWGPDTIYQGVRVLTPGDILEYDARSGTHRMDRHDHGHAPLQQGGANDIAGQLDLLMTQEIERMADMDVPFCSVLSGGLDSSYVTSIVKNYKDNLDVFNISYDSRFPGDERKYAELVARRHEVTLNHIEVDVNRLPDHVKDYVNHLDQPNYAPHCLSTYMLFKEINRSGYKVAFTGEGADELFCGYGRFMTAAADCSNDWFDRFYLKYGVMPCLRGDWFRADYLEHLSGESVGPEFQNDPGNSRMRNILTYDFRARFPYYILRRVDSLSMASAVEVRMPFLQPRIIGLSRQLGDDHLFSAQLGKLCVLDASKGYLPEEILTRKKQPFTFPIHDIMKETPVVRDYVIDTVFSAGSALYDYFDVAYLRGLLAEELTKTATSMLWAILLLQEWRTANIR